MVLSTKVDGCRPEVRLQAWRSAPVEGHTFAVGSVAQRTSHSLSRCRRLLPSLPRLGAVYMSDIGLARFTRSPAQLLQEGRSDQQRALSARDVKALGGGQPNRPTRFIARQLAVGRHGGSWMEWRVLM
jgi:hypothetical protein